MKEQLGAFDKKPILQVGHCNQALARACKEIGIAKLTHYDLRHLFATRCIESGVDIPTVSRWFGHKDGGALTPMPAHLGKASRIGSKSRGFNTDSAEVGTRSRLPHRRPLASADADFAPEFHVPKKLKPNSGVVCWLLHSLKRNPRRYPVAFRCHFSCKNLHRQTAGRI